MTVFFNMTTNFSSAFDFFQSVKNASVLLEGENASREGENIAEDLPPLACNPSSKEKST